MLADWRSEIAKIAARDWNGLEDCVYEQTLAALEDLPDEQKEAMGDHDAAARRRVAASMIVLRGWLETFVTEDPGEAWSGGGAPVLAVFGGLDSASRPAVEP